MGALYAQQALLEIPKIIEDLKASPPTQASKEIRNLDYICEFLLVSGCHQDVQVIAEALVAKAQYLHELDVAVVSEILANLYQKQYKSNEALEHISKALSIRRKLQPDSHITVQAAFTTLAIILKQLGKFTEAIEVYKDMLPYLEKRGETQLLANTINNLAVLLMEQGKLEEAGEQHKRALSIRTKLFGENHTDAATSYHNMALLCKRQGKLAEAEEHYRKALSIRTKLFGEIHPDVAVIMHNMTTLMKAQGKFDKALENAEKVLAINLKLYGEQHPEVADSYDSLGNTLHSMERKAEAIEKFKETLSIRANYYGDQHRDTLYSLELVGRLLKEMGNVEEATELFKRGGMRSSILFAQI